MKLPVRMTDVLSRVPFDVNYAFNAFNRGELDTAATNCIACRRKAKCDRWVEGHAEGAGDEPPQFCPNATYMKSFAPVRAKAKPRA